MARVQETTPIVFKTEASLWDMLEDGSKRFDMRRWDLADDRIYRLAWRKDGHWAEPTVGFLNKETGDILIFEYKGVEFLSWAPSWGFLRLGQLVKKDTQPLPGVKDILDDPAAHRWLKDALYRAQDLDPVDAANDAEVLARVLRRRAREVLSRGLAYG